jgi:hypothetical protein
MHDALLVEQRRTNQLLATLIELQGGAVPEPLAVPGVSVPEAVAAPQPLAPGMRVANIYVTPPRPGTIERPDDKEDGYFFVRHDDSGEVVRYWRLALRPLSDEHDMQANEAPRSALASHVEP